MVMRSLEMRIRTSRGSCLIRQLLAVSPELQAATQVGSAMAGDQRATDERRPGGDGGATSDPVKQNACLLLGRR